VKSLENAVLRVRGLASIMTAVLRARTGVSDASGGQKERCILGTCKRERFQGVVQCSTVLYHDLESHFNDETWVLGSKVPAHVLGSGVLWPCHSSSAMHSYNCSIFFVGFIIPPLLCAHTIAVFCQLHDSKVSALWFLAVGHCGLVIPPLPCTCTITVFSM